MVQEGQDNKGRFTTGNQFWRQAKQNGGTPNTTGLPSVNDIGKKEYNKLYMRYKRKNDKEFLKKGIIRGLVNKALKENYKDSKSNKANYYLGIKVSSYRAYIESLFTGDMNWSNRSVLWQIDHIKPLSLFNLLDENECLSAFNYKNTQPLTKEENLRKSNNYISKEQIEIIF